MATLALFIALGGSSYAVTQLPRNSVGSAQITRSAVGSSELHRDAVSSRAIRNRSVALQDISVGARASLRGAKGDPGDKGDPGPPGVTYRAVVNSGGGVVRGNASISNHQGGSGRYALGFPSDVSACIATATLSEAQNGPTLETPPAGPGDRGRGRRTGRCEDVRRRGRVSPGSPVQRDRRLLTGHAVVAAASQHPPRAC